MLGIVGQSGAGKSTLLHIIGALDRPSAGAVYCANSQVNTLSEDDAAEFRNREIGYVWQFHYLLPEFTALENVAMPLLVRRMTPRDAKLQAGALLSRVGLAERLQHRPAQLSGGERQRVGIARALAGESRLILLDEPVSSLDASIRRGVIELLEQLQAELGCGYVLVSHDFTTVEALADRIAVMHGGQVVEQGEARNVLEHPKHPYTRELLAACPRLPGGVGSEAWTTQRGSFSA